MFPDCQECHKEPAVAIILDKFFDRDILIYIGEKCLKNKKFSSAFFPYDKTGALIMLDDREIELHITELSFENQAIFRMPLSGGGSYYYTTGKKDIILECQVIENKESIIFDLFEKGMMFPIKFKFGFKNKICYGHGYGTIYKYSPVLISMANQVIIEKIVIHVDTKALFTR